MVAFTPGLQLGRFFYEEAVKPVLDAQFRTLAYGAAIIGSGSEVLGFDTEMSSDHHWGPRVMLFLRPDDYERYAMPISNTLSHHLPYTFRGYSTNFTPPDPNDNGVQRLHVITDGPVNHRVEIFTVSGFCEDYLGVDATRGLSVLDWLTIPQQKLRTTTAGAVYHDSTGELTRLRKALTYYPHDVWLYMLAAGWARIGQEEHLMGRAGYVGDELGSRLIASRLVHDLMNLCFLIEKQYAPYSKWFGTAFARLACAADLTLIFHEVLSARTWQAREQHLVQAYEIVAQMHNNLGVTDPVNPTPTPFFGRPFMVIQGSDFASVCVARITDPEVAQIAQRTLIGSVDQFSTSTDFVESTRVCNRAQHLYE